MSRNPYTQGNKVEVKESVCAYFDILGYSEIIKQAQKNDTSNLELIKLHDAISNSIEYLNDYQLEIKQGSTNITRKKIDAWATKTFSDNFIMGFPLIDTIKNGYSGGREINEIIDCIGLFQMHMALSGYCIRGSITIGELYIGDDLVYGTALLEAHDGEVKLARDSRIILLNSAVEFARDSIASFKKQGMLPDELSLSHELVEDTDGQFFVNYLHSSRFKLGKLDQNQTLNKHKEFIEENLTMFNSFTKNWNKYYWLANYHNYYCDKIKLNSKLKIDISSFIKQPYQFKDFK